MKSLFFLVCISVFIVSCHQNDFGDITIDENENVSISLHEDSYEKIQKIVTEKLVKRPILAPSFNYWLVDQHEIILVDSNRMLGKAYDSYGNLSYRYDISKDCIKFYSLDNHVALNSNWQVVSTTSDFLSKKAALVLDFWKTK